MACLTAFHLWSLRIDLPYAKGHEFEWVARSLASGQGYAFPAEHRWLFADTGDPAPYPAGPTAWVEPVYTLLMALCLKLFGNSGRTAIIVLQALFLILTSLGVLVIARRSINLRVGLLASLLLLLIPAIPYITLQSLSNPALAGLLAVLSTGLILWTLEQVSVRRCVMLGLFLGFATLTHSALATFIPVATVFIFRVRQPARWARWSEIFVIPLCALAVLSPWILRNMLVFGQFVPLRDGFGFNAYLGNPALVETFDPSFQACPGEAGPAFRAASAWEAMRFSLETSNQRALYARAYTCIRWVAPQEYLSMNEAQRDRLFLSQTLKFVASHPLQFIQVTIFKTLLFFGSRLSRLVFSLLALAGGVLAFKQLPARLIGLLILAFSVPYILALPFFYRYRYPVEPLMAILASQALILLVDFIIRLIQGAFRRLHPPAGSGQLAG